MKREQTPRGEILYRSEPGHECKPGWKNQFVPPGERHRLPFGVTVIRVPPTWREFPPGTVWQCATCGKTWVSCPDRREEEMPGLVLWKRESRFARWRRTRRMSRSSKPEGVS